MCFVSILGVGLAATTPAAAEGTFGLVEGRAGGAVDPSGSDPGPSWGGSLGTTFRLGRTPLRLYLLGNADGRSLDRRAGFGQTVEAASLDLVGSLRLVIPLAGPVRLFAEGGVGTRYLRQRFFVQTAPISQEDWAPVGLVGLGIQVRPWRPLSFTTRVTYTGHGGRDDLAHRFGGASTDLVEWTLGVGVHF